MACLIVKDLQTTCSLFCGFTPTLSGCKSPFLFALQQKISLLDNCQSCISSKINPWLLWKHKEAILFCNLCMTMTESCSTGPDPDPNKKQQRNKKKKEVFFFSASYTLSALCNHCFVWISHSYCFLSKTFSGMHLFSCKEGATKLEVFTRRLCSGNTLMLLTVACLLDLIGWASWDL